MLEYYKEYKGYLLTVFTLQYVGLALENEY